MTAFQATLWLLLIASAALYGGGWYRLTQQHRKWRLWRPFFFYSGIALLLFAFSGPVMSWSHHSLQGHMAQHLLIGMFAPVALVLGAPISLALRTLPVQLARALVWLMRTEFFGWASHPFTALLLNTGGMFLLYLTPIYVLSQTHLGVHIFVHIHFLLAGYLFAWSIAGPDPAPRRPGLRLRLAVVFLSMALHAWLAKLMYINLWPAGTNDTVDAIQYSAKMMYYWGDLAELLLVVALFCQWYRNDRRGACAGTVGEPPVEHRGALFRKPTVEGNSGD